MSKKINISIKKLFSVQLKKAIFYAFLEARKHRSTTIDSQFLLFGILKTENSLATKLFQQLYKSKSSSLDPIDKLLLKLRVNFQLKTKSNSFSTDRIYPNFSRPVRRLLFFLIKAGQNQQSSVITTLQVLNYLLRHKYVCKFIKESLVTS